MTLTPYRRFYFALGADPGAITFGEGGRMDFSSIVAVIAALSGIALGWLGRTRTIKQDIAQESAADAVQRVDVEYIKRGVDDMKVEVRLQGQRFEAVSERLTRVEESTKQAHKRIDRLEEQIKEA